MNYINVVIDNKSDNTDNFFTYKCEFDVNIGQKVLVPFSLGNKEKDAYVFEKNIKPKGNIKKIKSVLRVEKEITLNEEIIETCIWMKKRYLCRYIDAVKLFLPSGSSPKRRVSKIPHREIEGEKQDISELTEEQKVAIIAIEKAISSDTHDIFLLHGVTGSGKTEVYMQSIERALNKGKSAIMLVPEIALTKQIIDRFIGRFGVETIAVLHSKLSLSERYDEWKRISSGQVRIVIGARSAIFSPLKNIGVIILDEEHEATYKSDMSPKYDTVEVAIKRAKAYDGSVILGSATPSIVTYNRGEENIYKVLSLKERYNKIPLPEVQVMDMREELREGNKSIFSRVLYKEMEETFQRGKQTILFLNRRGYSTFISCRDCGYVSKCKDCGISLTYHKRENRSICHYCGHSEKIENICPECGSKHIRHFGTGTEKVEEMVEEYFPEMTVARLDVDSVKKKSVNKILNDFGKGKIDILIGTQMVAKGLDFRNVDLVGIIAADTTLNIPDFRSAERTFQLITQAAGRAGRGDYSGKVIIQTYQPDNYAIEAAAGQDYDKFYKQELELRELMLYPPFSDLIQIIFSCKYENIVEENAKKWHEDLLQLMGGNQYIFEPQWMNTVAEKEGYKQYILIKSPKGKRNLYLGAIKKLKDMKKKEKSKCNVAVDINPYSIWRS